MALEFPPSFPFHRPSKPSPEQSASEQPSHDASAAHRPAAVPASPARRSSAQVVMSTAERPSIDRRRAPRQTLVAKASIRPDSPVQMGALMSSGFVSNISMNGVGFHTRKPLAVGEKYRITLELGPMKWSSRMRIVSCRHDTESETFDVGAEFVGNELSRHLAAA